MICLTHAVILSFSNLLSSFDEAVEACATDLVELMLEYGKSHPGGVDVNGRSPMGRTPLNRYVDVVYSSC